MASEKVYTGWGIRAHYRRPGTVETYCGKFAVQREDVGRMMKHLRLASVCWRCDLLQNIEDMNDKTESAVKESLRVVEEVSRGRKD